MAIEAGYSRYACDRSEKAHADGKKPIEYMKPDDKRAKDWTTVKRPDAQGVPTERTFCPECSKKYASIETTWMRDFKEFIDEGMY